MTKDTSDLVWWCSEEGRMSAGLLCAIGSAVFNGSFVIPYKHHSLVNVKPLIFQFYCATGVMLSAFLVLPLLPMNKDILEDDGVGTTYEFSSLGFLSGMILVCAISLSFSAVEVTGVGN